MLRTAPPRPGSAARGRPCCPAKGPPAAGLVTAYAEGLYYLCLCLKRDLKQARARITLAAKQGFEHAKEKHAVVDEMIAQEAKK